MENGPESPLEFSFSVITDELFSSKYIFDLLSACEPAKSLNIYQRVIRHFTLVMGGYMPNVETLTLLSERLDEELTLYFLVILPHT